MNLKKLAVVLAVLAVAALLLVGGGLLAMYGLGLTSVNLPYQITFVLLMTPVLFLFALLSWKLSSRKPMHARAITVWSIEDAPVGVGVPRDPARTNQGKHEVKTGHR